MEWYKVDKSKGRILRKESERGEWKTEREGDWG